MEKDGQEEIIYLTGMNRMDRIFEEPFFVNYG